MRRRRILSSTSVLLLFTMGCYTYVPASAGGGLPPVGEQVQVDVSENEATRLNLAEVLPQSPTSLQGELVSNGVDVIEILVPVVDPAASGVYSQEIHQRIEVRRDGIVRVTRRELSRMRTGLAVGSGTVLFLSVFLSGLSGIVGSGSGPTEINKPGDTS